MKIHPRTSIVQKAGLEIAHALLAAEEKFNLTPGELVHILGNELMRMAKWQIREERHPNSPNTPGDLA